MNSRKRRQGTACAPKQGPQRPTEPSVEPYYAWHRSARERGAFLEALPGNEEAIKVAATLPFPDWVRWYVRPRSRRGRLRELLPGVARQRHLYGQFIEGVDVVMQFERLQADFDEVLERLGLPPTPIPTINVTEDRAHGERSYRQYYDDRARKLVERRFAPDLERFGYEF